MQPTLMERTWVVTALEWMVKSTIGIPCLGVSPALLLARCVTLERLLHFFVPQLPSIEHRIDYKD